MWDSSSGFLITWYKSLPSLASVHLFVCIMCGVVCGSMAAYKLPEYTDTPSNVTYYRGERAVLQCGIRHLGTKQVIWKRAKGEHVLTVGDMVFVADKDIDVTHVKPLKGHKDSWNLIISNVQPRHAGLYECQISTAEDIKRYVQLNVINKPVPVKKGIKIASNKPFVEKGNPIVLTCNATGEESAPRDVDWFKDGAKVKQNQNRGLTISSFRLAATRTLHSQLEIDHSEMTDAGNYICRSSRDIVSTSVVVLNAENNQSKRGTGSSTGDASAACSLMLRREGLFICIVYILTFYWTVGWH